MSAIQQYEQADTLPGATKDWYVIYAKARQEVLARDNLARQGYEVYLPLTRNRRRRRGKHTVCVEPLFPRYLFIRLDKVTDNWGPIRSTFGVQTLVRFGDQPARVPGNLVDALMSHDDEEGCQNLPVVDFQPGEAVRIVDGVMAGYEGIVRARNSTDRVTILLDFAGKYTELAMSRHQLEHVR
jgi:transcriptional antiterminator RfaH